MENDDNDHPLQNAWVFWAHHVKDNTFASYNVDLEPIGDDFNDVESFMNHYKSLPPPRYAPFSLRYTRCAVLPSIENPLLLLPSLLLSINRVVPSSSLQTPPQISF
jgi:hypothetical protein